MNGKTMKGIVAALAGMLVMACSGCGGGGGGSPPAPTPQPAPAPAKTVVINAEGDSTMYGNEFPGGVLKRTQTPPPVAAQAALRDQFGASVTVVNNGIPGTTVLDDLQGITTQYGSEVALPTKLASDPAQIVVENFGINDSVKGGMTPQIFHDQLTTWVTTVRGMGKIPVLEEPNPVTHPEYAAGLPDYVAAVDQVAKEQNVTLIDQYAYIQSIPNWQSMLTDGIHPDDQLYTLKGQHMAKVLAPIVKSFL